VPPHEAGQPSGISRLRRRADFLNAAKGKRFHTQTFTLQMVPQVQAALESKSEAARVGLTVTKKTGAAVERNRIRRRLKEVLRHLPELPIHAAHDYVIIAKREALTAPFEALKADLLRAMVKVHAPRSGDKTRGRRTKPAEGLN
jgi:ribonuclease P protein component